MIFTDTSDFFAIDAGDEIEVAGKRYRVSGYERERRFGIEDPKYWVKRAWDPETGERKIIKLSYFESFETTLGGVRIHCFRNPDKEGRILDLVRHRPGFMQGKAYLDAKGNNIRIIDIVRGPNFFVYLDGFQMDHEIYVVSHLPGILKALASAFEQIQWLHCHGFRHGDIRNDHIIVEKRTGNYVWIDFDYDYEATENPFALDIFGLGNILLYAIGRGFYTVYQLKNDPTYQPLLSELEPADFSILDKRRLMNLKKLFPYIPESLNDILMHFSRKTDVYYDEVQEVLEDLNQCLANHFS